MKFCGREREVARFKEHYTSKGSNLLCLYGRRRVGKSALIREFAIQTKAPLFVFEGLEDQRTREQIRHFRNTLAKYLNDDVIAKAEFNTWDEIFNLLSKKLLERKNKQKKLIIAFDELQWMAAKRTQLISLIKYFWDNVWKEHNVVLILCGSVATFMVDKVIHSKALYGRIDLEILLKPMGIRESKQFFLAKRSNEEIIKYFMIFGGIPKYFEEINMNQSLKQNLQRLCFEPNGFFVEEFAKVFNSQFKEPRIYMRIVELLNSQKLSFNEIAAKLKMNKGGGLQRYLINLEKAQIISSYCPSTLIYKSGKNKKYAIVDEYLSFYFKFIQPNLTIIKKNDTENLFHKLCESKWQPWLGLAFERFVFRNAIFIAELMGFAEEVIDYSPYFNREEKIQIDLMYVRQDKVITICEVKFHEQVIDTKVIAEMESKINKFQIPKGYTLERALISFSGQSKALKDSDYFHHSLSLKEIIN